MSLKKLYKIGKKRVTENEFDSEIARLISADMTQPEIAVRMKTSLRTIQRSFARLGDKSKEAKETAKIIQDYKLLEIEDFEKLPELQKWIEGLRGRKIKGYHQTLSKIKVICDTLKIYPAQLDFDYSMKWLALPAQQEQSNRQLRGWKLAIRSFLSGTGQKSPTQLTNEGIDAKHHQDGMYATVLLSEEEIQKVENHLRANEQIRALAVFKVGSECCCPLQELESIRKDSFFDDNGVTVLRTYREKTGAYWTKYPKADTVELWKTLEVKGKDGKVFTRNELKYEINPVLQIAYSETGLKNEYFFNRPAHSLRHIGIQRILRNPEVNYNYSIGAMLGGWEDERTLHLYYGAVPGNVVRKAGASLWII